MYKIIYKIKIFIFFILSPLLLRLFGARPLFKFLNQLNFPHIQNYKKNLLSFFEIDQIKTFKNQTKINLIFPGKTLVKFKKIIDKNFPSIFINLSDSRLIDNYKKKIFFTGDYLVLLSVLGINQYRKYNKNLNFNYYIYSYYRDEELNYIEKFLNKNKKLYLNKKNYIVYNNKKIFILKNKFNKLYYRYRCGSGLRAFLQAYKSNKNMKIFCYGWDQYLNHPIQKNKITSIYQAWCYFSTNYNKENVFAENIWTFYFLYKILTNKIHNIQLNGNLKGIENCDWIKDSFEKFFFKK